MPPEADGQRAAGEAPPDDLGDVLDTLGAEGGQVFVYRVVGGTREYLDAMDASVFSLDEVRQKWGGGRYQCRVKDAQTGKWVRGGARTFAIAGDPRRTDRAGDDAPSWLPRLIEAFALRMPPPPPPDSARGALDVLSSIGQLAQAQTAQTVALVTALVPLFRGGGSRAVQPAQMMELVMKAMEIGADTAAKAGGAAPAGAAGVLGTLGPRVLDLIERATGIGAPPEPAGTLLPSTAEADGMPIPVPAKSSPFAELAPWLPRLLRAADGGEDPEVWADTIMAVYPPAAEMVARLAARRGEVWVLSELAATFPDAITAGTPRYAWCAGLVRALTAVVAAEVAEADLEEEEERS